MRKGITARISTLLAAVVLNLALLLPPMVINRPTPAAQPAVAVFLFIVSMFCLLDALSSHSEPPRRAQRFSDPDIWLARLTGLALLAVFWISLSDLGNSEPGYPATVAWIAGAAIMLIGMALRWAAMRKLGSRFTSEIALAGDQMFETGGVYRFMRHPSETGLLCIALGASLLLGSHFGCVAGALILFPLSIIRARREEQALTAQFAAAYEAYVGSVPMFVPDGRRRTPATLRV